MFDTPILPATPSATSPSSDSLEALASRRRETQQWLSYAERWQACRCWSTPLGGILRGEPLTLRPCSMTAHAVARAEAQTARTALIAAVAEAVGPLMHWAREDVAQLSALLGVASDE